MRGATKGRAEHGGDCPPELAATWRSGATGWLEQHFGRCVAGAVVLAAAVRLFYVLRDARWIIGGDGFDYHLSSLRLADGLGYTSPWAQELGRPYAQHPPGWVTVLGGVSWLGGRSQEAHQLTGAAIGLGIVVVAGLVGRRYFDAPVGVLAALLAAIYPGFWLLGGNILSEPLALLLVGIFMLLVADLRDRPTLLRALVIGLLLGVLALTRAEELALLLLVVAPVLLMARTLAWRTRIVYLLVAVVACGATIAPWATYNTSRFADPVILSTNGGGLLLVGNCPPSSYRGDWIGFFDKTCRHELTLAHPGLDRSQIDTLSRRRALENLVDHAGRLPVVVPARLGRMLALYNPSQTVDWVANWMTTGTAPIWAWVASFWVLLVLAAFGVVRALRTGVFLLPLAAPLVIAVVLAAVSYGEPRYHSVADLGIIVLASAGLRALVLRARHERAPLTTAACGTRRGG